MKYFTIIDKLEDIKETFLDYGPDFKNFMHQKKRKKFIILLCGYLISMACHLYTYLLLDK